MDLIINSGSVIIDTQHDAVIQPTGFIMTENIYIRVYLKQDPTTEVVVATTYDKLRSKRNSIKGDIRNQKFPRWAPFAKQLETTAKAPTTEGYILETLDDQKRSYAIKAAEWKEQYDAAYEQHWNKNNDTTNQNTTTCEIN